MMPESLIKAATFVRMTSNQEVVFLEICVAFVIVIEKKIVICLPTEHQGVRKNSLKRVRAWNLKVLVFKERWKSVVPGEKPLGARERTNNKLNSHMV